MRKKVISVILVMMLVIGLVPFSGEQVHAASFSYNPTTYTSDGYKQHSLNMIFNKYPNGSKFSSSGYKGGYQCYGFAKYCVDTIGFWSGKYGSKRTVLNYSLNQTNIKKLSKYPMGTHVRIGNINATMNGGEDNGHSIVILKVDNSNICYAEANWAKPNKVTYTNSTIKAFDNKYSGYSKIQYVDAPKYKRASGSKRVNYYTVQYKPNGGTGTMSNTKVIYGKSTATKANAFSRSGYVFDGWKIRRYINDRIGWQWYCQKGNVKTWCKTLPEGYGYVKYRSGAKVAYTASAGSTVQFYATWKRNNEPAVKHNFSYNMNGGTGTISSVNVNNDDTLQISSTQPTREGYTFKGWAVKRLADEKWYIAGKGWYTDEVIVQNKYIYKVYYPSQSYVIDSSWTTGAANSDYCFYALWSKNTTDAASTLSLSSYTSGPSGNVLRGTSVYVKGNVKSNYIISDLTIRIINSNNQIVQTGSYAPNAYTADLSKADVGYIYFSKLPAGKYIMQIMATDSKQTKVIKNVSFNIANTTFTGYKGPAASIKKGTSVYIKGTIKSYYKINTVSIAIYNSSGKCVQLGKYSPNAYTADVSKADIGKIYFSKLGRGSYVMKIRSITSQGTTIVKTVNFTVK